MLMKFRTVHKFKRVVVNSVTKTKMSLWNDRVDDLSAGIFFCWVHIQAKQMISKKIMTVSNTQPNSVCNLDALMKFNEPKPDHSWKYCA